MTLAVAGFWLWGWIDALKAGIRRITRREKRVSLIVGLNGSVKRRISHAIDVDGTVLRKVGTDVSFVGDNYTLATLVLLGVL